MTFSIGLSGAQQITSAEIQSLAVEDAFLLVNHQRLENTGKILKSQIAEAQEKNSQISDINDLMSLARNVLAGFGSDDKSDAAIPLGDDLTKFQQACQSAGFDTKDIGNKAQLTATLENFKSKVDSLTNSQQISMLRLQSTVNVYSETLTALTNFMSTTHDRKSEILRNI